MPVKRRFSLIIQNWLVLNNVLVTLMMKSRYALPQQYYRWL